jgi:hypothetical protein
MGWLARMMGNVRGSDGALRWYHSDACKAVGSHLQRAAGVGELDLSSLDPELMANYTLQVRAGRRPREGRVEPLQLATGSLLGCTLRGRCQSWL